MNNTKSKNKIGFVTIAGICFIVAFILLIGIIAGFTIKIVKDQSVTFNNQGLIRVTDNNIAPDVNEGKLCLYNTNIDDVKTGDIIVVFHGGVYSLRRVNSIVEGAYYISNNQTTMIVAADKIVGKYVKQMDGLSNWFEIFVSREFWVCLLIIAICAMLGRIICVRARRIKNLKLIIQDLSQ